MNDVIHNIYERRSIRHFTDRPIEKSLLEEIIKAAVQAPNGQNRQSWKLTVISEHKTELFEKIKTTLAKTQSDSLHGVDNPSAVVIVSDRRSNYNAIANGACAINTMLLAAWSLGIGGCWINALRTIYDEPEIRELLLKYEIPGDHLIIGMVVLGYIPDGELPKKPHRRPGVINWIDD